MHKILFYTSPQGESLLIRRCCENPRLSNIFLNYVSYTLIYCHLFTRTNTTHTCGIESRSASATHVKGWTWESAVIQRSAWTRARFTRLSLASINMRERNSIHAAILNTSGMKHSVFSPRGGADEQTHTDHRQRRRAITGGPRRGRAAHHACKKQTRREPGIHSDAVSFPKAWLGSS